MLLRNVLYVLFTESKKLAILSSIFPDQYELYIYNCSIIEQQL
mgnify:CR=1 FL=1